MNRRSFLAAALAPASPIVDTHIHLFDTTRPQGVPWPAQDNPTLFQPAMPARLRRTATPFGVTGAIAVECSPWLEDNRWLLDTAASDPFLLGVVGNLNPGEPGFAAHLERFRRHPLFLGIRYGNIWQRDLSAAVRRPAFLSDLKLLAQAGLVLDSANPDPALIGALLVLATKVPELRIVVDHLPRMEPNPAVRELAGHLNVFVKLSAVLRRDGGAVPAALAFYQPRLDALFELFGPDRVLYGSDWPNGDQWGSYAQVFSIVRDYFAIKGPAAANRFFSANAAAVYRWPAVR